MIHLKKSLKINLRVSRKNHLCIAEGFKKLGIIYYSLENFKQKDKCFELARRNELKLV
ncbi:hypothetical protein DB41_IB00060 [Neochlamydia sp. TUME1]|nr:hypothetical protein DB41_IB00060 [Neochlamydia sp. TUME1]